MTKRVFLYGIEGVYNMTQKDEKQNPTKLTLCVIAEAALLYLFYLSGDLTLETVCYIFLAGFFVPKLSEDFLEPVILRLLNNRRKNQNET
jgi:hypothetical protein